MYISEAKVRGNRLQMIGDMMCVYLGVQGGRVKAGGAILLSKWHGRFLEGVDMCR